MKRDMISEEGVVLHARDGREGGKILTLFTKRKGKMNVFLPRAVMNRCGMGLTAPFSYLCFTIRPMTDYAVMSQYEGTLLFDMMKCTYEEMTCWYYLIELIEKCFPEGDGDERAYRILLDAGREGRTRNPLTVSFVAAVKMISAAGFDCTSKEAAEDYRLSEDARKLLYDFREYDWKVKWKGNISKEVFLKAASYLDDFIERECDISMNTKGTFLRYVNGA